MGCPLINLSSLISPTSQSTQFYQSTGSYRLVLLSTAKAHWTARELHPCFLNERRIPRRLLPLVNWRAAHSSAITSARQLASSASAALTSAHQQRLAAVGPFISVTICLFGMYRNIVRDYPVGHRSYCIQTSISLGTEY